MKFARIEHIAYYLPKNILTNEELRKKHLDWNIDSLEEKIGIHTRHIAAEDETALDLAVNACNKLFDEMAHDKQTIDTLIVCTQCQDYKLPPNSPQLQHLVGLSNSICAFDIMHGCSGYVYGLSLAKSCIESGQSKKVLFVTADTYTRYIRPDNRSVRTIFGDAATATLLVAQESPTPFLGPFCFATDGSGAQNLIIAGSGARQTLMDENEKGLPGANELYMNGAAIFAFTLESVPALVKQTLNEAGLSIEHIDSFVFHQANAHMLKHLQKKCSIPPEKFHIFMKEIGNTVSSSIPLVLLHNINSGNIKKQDRLLLIGFGVGYSSAACILTL